jgi:NADPH:quinone reductase-like Zn-dependent oxidoreductase
MKAAVYRRYGSPDVVSVDEVPKPVPRDDEVLVRIHAATLGVVDSLARRGAPLYARSHSGLRRPRFAVLGSDFAGQIEAAGPAVTRLAAGRSRPGRYGTGGPPGTAMKMENRPKLASCTGYPR